MTTARSNQTHAGVPPLPFSPVVEVVVEVVVGVVVEVLAEVVGPAAGCCEGFCTGCWASAFPGWRVGSSGFDCAVSRVRSGTGAEAFGVSRVGVGKDGWASLVDVLLRVGEGRSTVADGVGLDSSPLPPPAFPHPVRRAATSATYAMWRAERPSIGRPPLV
jgi:hypothetical protein